QDALIANAAAGYRRVAGQGAVEQCELGKSADKDGAAVSRCAIGAKADPAEKTRAADAGRAAVAAGVVALEQSAGDGKRIAVHPACPSRRGVAQEVRVDQRDTGFSRDAARAGDGVVA